MDNKALWERFRKRYFVDRQIGIALDTSRMNFTDQFIGEMGPALKKAYAAIEALEKGSIANPDESRMVGHYWLRDAAAAPTAEISAAITDTVSRIKKFAHSVHQGELKGSTGERFAHLLVVGIGGSALGPQFVNQALSSASDPMDIYFFDNTDPDGMQKVLGLIPDLSKTLCVIISKSGGTKETRNGQLIAKEALRAAKLDFAKHFVAVTGEGSELDKTATAENWIARFPMWDWVGGRTSELSAVGLLPAALQGFDIELMLRGAREMDALTRRPETAQNPAALLALSWYHAGKGRGLKDMVVLPYKDRLELFSRYLQQLLMESLGKEHDLDGKVVNQGIAVYGNKGSTDQHAYVQQLRDGVNNFFAVFIEVLRDESPKTSSSRIPVGFASSRVVVEEATNAGDYLSGFFLGTRKALFEKDRESVSITVDLVNEYTVGLLIALFERTVSIYAVLVNINAYHQPGVEAGKKAAAAVLALQHEVTGYLKTSAAPQSVEQIAGSIGKADEAETIFKLLRRLAANGRVEITAAGDLFEDRYSLVV